jgi:hypothetical protein
MKKARNLDLQKKHLTDFKNLLDKKTFVPLLHSISAP